MVKITNETRKNVLVRYFWLNMRNLMMKKLTIQKNIWYNGHTFKGKKGFCSAK